MKTFGLDCLNAEQPIGPDGKQLSLVSKYYLLFFSASVEDL